MKLRPLPWQQPQWQQLQLARGRQRLAHAVLLTGPAGVGKHQFMAALIASLLCEQPQDQGVACGACRGCIQREAGSHPDLLLLRPPEGKKQIAIESVRGLSEKLALARHYPTPRIAVIDLADQLNASSANALLKLVEEPPAATHLIFINERLQRLPATLRSRCQMFRFGLPPVAQSLAYMGEMGVSESLAEVLLLQAGGAPLRAVEAHRPEQVEALEQWQKMVDSVAAGRSPAQTQQAIAKEDAPAFLLWLQRATEQRLKQAVAGLSQESLDPSGLLKISDEIGRARRVLEGNGNPQMVIESVMILWWKAHRQVAQQRGKA